jgi:hypothetical protein
MAKVARAKPERFPILTRFPPQSTGIARLTAASSPAGEGYRMELRSLPVRSVLNRRVSRRGLSFAWIIIAFGTGEKIRDICGAEESDRRGRHHSAMPCWGSANSDKALYVDDISPDQEERAGVNV